MLVRSLNLHYTILFSLLDLEINLSPSGTTVKGAGGALKITFQVEASGETKVSWTKVKNSLYTTLSE